MPPALRKFMLAVHLTVSVGWIGAVAGYIALDVATATGQDADTLRASYAGMDLLARRVIVPLALASLIIVVPAVALILVIGRMGEGQDRIQLALGMLILLLMTVYVGTLLAALVGTAFEVAGDGDTPVMQDSGDSQGRAEEANDLGFLQVVGLFLAGGAVVIPARFKTGASDAAVDFASAVRYFGPGGNKRGELVDQLNRLVAYLTENTHSQPYEKLHIVGYSFGSNPGPRCHLPEWQRSA
jgi:hypothetical protein